MIFFFSLYYAFHNIYYLSLLTKGYIKFTYVFLLLYSFVILCLAVEESTLNIKYKKINKHFKLIYIFVKCFCQLRLIIMLYSNSYSISLSIFLSLLLCLSSIKSYAKKKNVVNFFLCENKKVK